MRTPRRKVVLNHHAAVRADLDLLSWACALTIASLLRVDLHPHDLTLAGQLAIIPCAMVLHLIAAAFVGLYDGRYRPGSFEEAIALGKVTAIVAPVLTLVDAVASSPRMVPLTAIPAGAVVALVMMCGFRWMQRLRLERRSRPQGADVSRVIVVGAGEGGEQVIEAMLHDPTGHYLPVAVLDDDPEKRTLRLKGIPVVGGTEQLAVAAEEQDAEVVLIAIPSASRDVIRRVTERANDAGLVVKVLPSVGELLEGRVGIQEIRNVTPADLLGRHEISTDVASISHYVRGRRVLVTGAGGSIGSELCRQLFRFEPSELVMLDRDESALHAIQLSLYGRALLDSPDVVLCDIRDREALRHVFERCRPEVVFHAAALKHLPMLEQYPVEGWKTNVLGSLNTLELAQAVGVERFVNVSTDKAADPSSVLGYTKRIAERLTAHFGRAATGSYLSVRFGNVLGSRGSMLDTFTRQISQGGPLTLTHPDVTRFFMTISEACELVVQAGALGKSGEVLVLAMGNPVRIADVAQQLIAQNGDEIELVFTGLRPGEKLHEVLFAPEERARESSHPLISRVDAPPLAPDLLPIGEPTPESVIAVMQKLCVAALDHEHA